MPGEDFKTGSCGPVYATEQTVQDLLEIVAPLLKAWEAVGQGGMFWSLFDTKTGNAWRFNPKTEEKASGGKTRVYVMRQLQTYVPDA